MNYRFPVKKQKKITLSGPGVALWSNTANNAIDGTSYSICNKNNWAKIVDELLDILAQNDHLLQEELVLRIAILAERNAPDFTW